MPIGYPSGEKHVYKNKGIGLEMYIWHLSVYGQ